ncbi:MAG: ribonuclease Z [bacterium]
MEDFKLTILGSGSAVPTARHNPSCQLVYHKGRQFMLDCGEGAQLQMNKYKLKYRKLDHIFISHLHGDHYYGLIGLINTYHLMRRESPLHIYGPARLQEVINLQLEVSATKLVYPLHFHSLRENESELLFEDPSITLTSFPLRHSLPVWGFLIREKPKLRRISKEIVKTHNLEVEAIKKIKMGGDLLLPDGTLLKHEEITSEPLPSRSYAYCTDTSYLESTAQYVQGVDLLYHESTFDDAQADLAESTRHSTASQAAKVAREAQAGKLLLGHYSARFTDLDQLLMEARDIFPDTLLSEEGKTYALGYERNIIQGEASG